MLFRSFEKAENDVHNFLKDPSRRRSQWINWGTVNNIDVSELMDEMDNREQILVAIESYFLSVLKDNPDALDKDTFSALISQTLAFYLADANERDALLAIFELIYERLATVPPEKYSYYGRTLLGLDQLSYIENWIDANLFELQLTESPEDLLNL